MGPRSKDRGFFYACFFDFEPVEVKEISCELERHMITILTSEKCSSILTAIFLHMKRDTMKANEIRKGTVIVHNNTPYRVMDFNHVTPGKGQAVVQTKLRNMLNGSQTEVRFGSTESVEEADIFSYKATYLYSDSDGFNFMNSDSYEQLALTEELLGDAVYYLQEQMSVDITTYNGEPIGIKLPQTVVLTVIETEPELKGATASNSPKPAITDTGLNLNVPPFVKQGEKIVVNTESGEYISRSDS